MKIHKGMVNARVVTQVVSHYRHAVYQSTDAAGTMPAFGVSRPERTINVIHIPTPNEAARKSKLIKSNGKMIRRITYK